MVPSPDTSTPPPRKKTSSSSESVGASGFFSGWLEEQDSDFDDSGDDRSRVPMMAPNPETAAPHATEGSRSKTDERDDGRTFFQRLICCCRSSQS